MTEQNKLYFSDNLKILRDHVAAESVDLIYLDPPCAGPPRRAGRPPFTSSATYNFPSRKREGQKPTAKMAVLRWA